MTLDKISAASWTKIAEALAHGGIVDDGDLETARDEIEYYGTFTRDTLADFEDGRLNRWPECRGVEKGEGWAWYRAAQAFKGQQRRDRCVVDCGDFRVCYEC